MLPEKRSAACHLPVWRREGKLETESMTSIIYAIGDVHGRSDLLARLIEFIDDHSTRSGRKPRVFFLGDIVDKGPDSRGAMDIVCETLRRWPKSQLLLGNHDFMFLDAMTNQRLVWGWYRNGAATTLRPYFGYVETRFCLDLRPDRQCDVARKRDATNVLRDIEVGLVER